MKRMILLAVLVLAATGSSQAGPLRNLAARVFHHGGCGGGCSSAPQAAPQYQPAEMPAVQQVVYQTGYVRDGDHVIGTMQYPTIRVGRWLPTTCGPNGCPR